MFYIVPTIKKLLSVSYIFLYFHTLAMQAAAKSIATQLQESLESCQEITLLSWSHESILFWA